MGEFLHGAERPAEPLDADTRNALVHGFHDKWHGTKPSERKDIVREVVNYVAAHLRAQVGEPREPPEPSEALQKAETLLRDERYAMSPVVRATLEGLAESVRAAEQMLDDGWSRQKIGLLRAGAPPTETREPVHYFEVGRWPIGGPYPCRRVREVEGAANCTNMVRLVECVECLRALSGGGPPHERATND